MTPTLDWLAEPCPPIDQTAVQHALARQDQLTKPPGSLGRLEELAVRLAGLQRTATPEVDPVRVLLFAADHGVAAEGVSRYPQDVTKQMVRNIANGGAGVAVMAKAVGAGLDIIELGLATGSEVVEGVRSEPLGPGSGNIAREPAMTPEQLARALDIGRDAVDRAVDAGVRLIIGGELGIANTTAAAALACALLDRAASEVVGPGTGLDSAGVNRKAEVVARALALHASEPRDPLEMLRRLGGFEIAALAGAYLRAAQRGVAMLIDGFIVSSAALAAVRLQPAARDWMLFSHRSAEPGHRLMMEALEADPLLDLGFRLGEATGACAAVPLLRLACAVHRDMATFDEAGVSNAC
ncbi:nicotinate-nucleotide--dimethylbenzimidazole phosphoribosyltransferase [Marichromatium gracile]|uniref:Nicotinate-nucleotide--dimethylbenzimidazole phosphoribosyltransferase n=1 Tax=Marichromatium gracile TaxID=1048 RepID=A0ABR5VDH5_MARGR|nr:nicotinate-nucleotide--dimethylbenzimidazole phosphoribosyltransferase [Marichromatium gracile]KXX63756.1 nicotinate-nucleotide--dimethylbenzimidazole phosphoribosyltransferase [Marichromatium gracile]